MTKDKGRNLSQYSAAKGLRASTGFLSIANLTGASSGLRMGLLCSGGPEVHMLGQMTRDMKGRWYWPNLPLAETHGRMPLGTQDSTAL